MITRPLATGKRGRVLFLLLLVISLLVAWYRLLPDPLFAVPYSTVVTDRDHRVLGLTVAADGQYRFPGQAALSPKYIAALLCFEDRRFLAHPGVDPLAILRAAWLNIKNGKITSGGSTLTMQVIRLARGNPPRTFREKLFEMLLAVRLEQAFTKWEILNLYANHAPFGGNIVGLRAAALKYFNRDPDALSWAEATLLAVLPNAPALIFPGKNTALLKAKRDRLLRVLHERGYFPAEDLLLAEAEPLPGVLLQPECVAPHVLARAYLQRRGTLSSTSIDSRLQERVNAIVKRHVEALQHNYIHNAAVLVAHIPTGEVRAYVGNSPGTRDDGGHHVDVITAPRSPGSILKPALYALMQREGYLLPRAIVPDIPTRFGTYAPTNFNKEFQGVVPADIALSSSLNVPFVRMLGEYGTGHLLDNLRRLGISTLDKDADHYGLSLILGGGECSLWDIANMYAGMASLLLHYRARDGLPAADEFSRLHLWSDAQPDTAMTRADLPLDAASAWLTLQALQEVERPDLESGWKHFASSVSLAWKTGTSFGLRDAWAVGVNAEHVIGVWVGNANGEGRPGLTGVRVAAPILFEVASLLPPAPPLPFPAEAMARLPVCRQSGYRASSICPEVDTVWACRAGENTPACPYHVLVHLDASERFRVHSGCEPVHRIKTRPWFVLSPVQEWYYARSRASYRKMPPYRGDCGGGRGEMMEMIYPRPGTRVFIPRDWGGVSRGVVFELVHREPATTVYWHVDTRYLGVTRRHHQMEVNLPPGPHLLHVVDAAGNSLEQYFTVVEADT
ncbi:MAG: penicillin-binding protein 1C, partial [Odoribacteraceae bacterium]|nr:penicillin-binding protein 1C [Odoribacteraceae bacterium]